MAPVHPEHLQAAATTCLTQFLPHFLVPEPAVQTLAQTPGAGKSNPRSAAWATARGSLHLAPKTRLHCGGDRTEKRRTPGLLLVPPEYSLI